MAGEEYRSVLEQIRALENKLADSMRSMDSTRSEFLAAKQALDVLKGKKAFIDDLIVEYQESLQRENMAQARAKDKQRADVERLGNLVSAPLFDEAERTRLQSEFKKEQKLISPFSKKGKEAEAEYKDELMKVLNENLENAAEADEAHARALIDYVSTPDEDNSAYFKQEEEFLALNQKHSGDKHKLRGYIKDAITEYNKANEDKIVPLFKDLNEIAKTDINEFNRQASLIDSAIAASTKFDGNRKEEMNHYMKRYTNYINEKNREKSRESRREKFPGEIDTIVERANKKRQAHNNRVLGEVPSLDDMDKMYDKDKVGYGFESENIDDIIKRYNAYAEGELRAKANDKNASVGNTQKDAIDFLPFDTLAEYRSKLAENKAARAALKQDEGKSKEIRSLLSGGDKGNSLAEKFDKLEEICKTDEREYNNTLKEIKQTVDEKGGANKNALKDYLRDYDIAITNGKNLGKAREALDNYIEKENTATKNRRNEVKQRLDEIEALTTAKAREEALVKRSNELEQEFNENYKAAKSDAKKANIKETLLNAGSDAIDKVYNAFNDLTVTMCVSAIKGQLAGEKEELDKIDDEIKQKKQALEDIDRINAADRLDIDKAVRTRAVKLDEVGGVVAADSDEVNKTFVSDAERKALAENLEREIHELTARYEKASQDYAKHVEEEKAAAKEALEDFFGVGSVKSADDVDEAKDKDGQAFDSKQADELRREIEAKVNEGLKSPAEKGAKQAEASLKQKTQAVAEAEQKSKEADIQERIQRVESNSEKLSKLYTEKNLTTMDTVTSFLQKGIEFCTSIGKDKSSDEGTKIDVKKTLEDAKTGLENLNKPKEQKEPNKHIATQVTDVCKEFRKTLGNVSKGIKTKAVAAQADARLKNLRVQSFEKEKQGMEEFKKNSNDSTKTPNYLNSKVNHIVNTDAAVVYGHQKEAEHIDGYIKETEERKAQAAKDVEAEQKKFDAQSKVTKEKLSEHEKDIAEKNKELEALGNRLHEARSKVVRDYTEENGNKEPEPLKVNGEDMKKNGFNGLDMLNKLTGEQFTKDTPQGDMKRALDKIYINGVSASQMFALDGALDGIKDKPDEVLKKYNEIGETFKQCFDETLALKDTKDKKSNMLTGQIIAVEDENCMLKPVVLTNGNIENEYHNDFSNRSSFKTAAYKDALNFNANCIDMCKSLNDVRREAAKAQYDKQAVQSMNKEEKKANVRRITLDNAIKQSTGIFNKPAAKTKAVDKSSNGIDKDKNKNNEKKSPSK
jgi:hypothetical protein